MKRSAYSFTAFFAAFCLALTMFSIPVRAYDDMTTGDAGVELIKRYESYSRYPYYENGYWYVGYGIQIKAGTYQDGVTEEEAEALLREHLSKTEARLNRFFSENRLSPTQSQFDALVDFTYTTGDAWLNGSSALLKLVREGGGESRRKTVRAFGVWSHAGGKVQSGLALRRMEEAALYLDGDASRSDDFVYLAVERQEGVTCPSDFAVYERGEAYDEFPVMIRLGYTLTGLETRSGELIRLGDAALSNVYAVPVWEKNTYSNSFDDVMPEDWFYDYIMELCEDGVVGGRGDGTFDPNAPVTVGEALKLVLLAAGAEDQTPTQSHWASGYASLMRELAPFPDGLLDELDAPVLRLDAARLAAIAIGFGQSFSDSPFDDTDDTYVTALADIGVVTGSNEGGAVLFHPERQLTRAEIATIVWRLRNTVKAGTVQTVRYGSRELEVSGSVPLNRYDKNSFSGSGKEMTYTAPDTSVLRGIDVSRFQGEIDWEAARDDGIEFAILRVGGRFWGSGEIYDDKLFEEYYEGADEAGLKLGYYFYSQAITAEEALEEADYVIEKLKGRRVDAPVVFDWETAGASDARTNGLPVSTVCECAAAFCERIKSAGYSPMIYMNTHDGYVKYDLSRLSGYDIWYAGQYNGDYPCFVYNFLMWQYTSSGQVNGIEGGVDMDLWFLN